MRKYRQRKNHRALSVFLSLALVCSLVAGTGFAASASETEDSYNEEVTAVETLDYEAEADSAEVLPGTGGESLLADEETESTEAVEAEETDATEAVETEEPEAYLVSAETSASVQARIDALPSVEEYAKLDSDAQNEIYAEAEELYDLFDALTEEGQEQVDTEKLYDLLDYFTGQIETIDEDSHSHDDIEGTLTAISSTTTISKNGNYYISEDFTGYIIVSENVTATLCLNGKTITSSGGSYAIKIDKGATLTLEDCSESGSGKITISDDAIGRAVYVVGGNFIMNGGTIADCKGFNDSQNYSGAGVYVYSYYDAGTLIEAGSFTMNGGLISNCEAVRGGGVFVYNNCTFTMDGGTIENCSASESNFNSSGCGGGVYVEGNATFTMAGGTIKGCSAENSGGAVWVSIYGVFSMQGGAIENCSAENSGGAVYVFNYGDFKMESGTIKNCSAENGGGLYFDGACTFTMSDGTIKSCSATGGSGKGGGIYFTTGTFDMVGGLISNCTAASGGGLHLHSSCKATISGGSISNCSVSGFGGGVHIGDGKNTVTVNGGTISGNIAGISGGGVYLLSNNTMTMTAGIISSNTAYGTFEGVASYYSGGGIYVDEDSTLYLKNVAIYDNKTTEQSTAYGGGIAACATANVTIYADNGAVVYSNTDSGNKNAQQIYIEGTTAAYNLFVSKYYLGGGEYNWTDASGNSVDVYNLNRSGEIILNNSLSSDDSGVQAAMNKATALIYGNTGLIGGGIACNGSLIIGTGETIDIPVSKTWVGDEETARPESVTVNLLLGETVVTTAELTKENNWSYTFTGLEVVDGLSYSVQEVAVDGYTSTVTGSVEDGFTITNTKTETETGNLTVSKTLSGNATDSSKEFSFTVTLDNSANSDTSISGTYGDMEFTDGVATFTLKGGESKTTTGLPAGMTYTVTESGNDGYTVTKTVDGTTVDEATGTIVSGETSSVVFNNHKDSEGGGGGGSTYTSVTVKKVWTLDDGGTAAASVTVNLLRNGTVYATVTLDENNNWTHTWSGLDDSYTWTVEEADVPDGFTSSTTHSGTTWTITNDDVPEDTDVPDEPDTSDTPSNPDKPDNPDTPSSPDSPSSPDTPSTPDRPLDDVPQTGDNTNLSLWLTLMFLALAGMAVTVIVGRRTRYCGAHEAKHRKR